MTEQPADSAPVVSGEQGLSVPVISGAKGGQPNSPEVREESELAKEFRELKAKVDKIERGEQSAKDRGLRKVETRLDELSKAFGYVEKYKDPETAKREMLIDEALSRMPADREEPSPRVSKDEELQAECKSRIEKHLGKKGIPIAEWGAATAGLQDKTFASVDDALETAMELVAAYQDNKRKQNAPASLAGAVAPAGGGAATTDLKAEYIKEINAARGKGAIAGRAIRDKYQKLGLDTSNISF